MNGVIELSWKILVSIITALIVFIIIFLIVAGLLNTTTISRGAREICLLLLSKLKVFGVGASSLQLCDSFYTPFCGDGICDTGETCAQDCPSQTMLPHR